jgi:hypothetical protein
VSVSAGSRPGRVQARNLSNKNAPMPTPTLVATDRREGKCDYLGMCYGCLCQVAVCHGESTRWGHRRNDVGNLSNQCTVASNSSSRSSPWLGTPDRVEQFNTAKPALHATRHASRDTACLHKSHLMLRAKFIFCYSAYATFWAVRVYYRQPEVRNLEISSWILSVCRVGLSDRSAR